MIPTYNPDVFTVRNVQQAMEIILTPEGGTSEERWSKETPYLGELIQSALQLGPDSLVLDYGCGIGRMSKELITRTGCQVIGVDISPTMRALSNMYVASERFFSCPPEMIGTLVARGARVDAALSIWVFQHCWAPTEDIARVKAVLRDEGQLFVVNTKLRAIPTHEAGWVNDGIDVRAHLRECFDEVLDGRLDETVTGPEVAERSYWALYRNRLTL